MPSKGPEAVAHTDRNFMETAVRLRRAGEGAAYTGLQPAGTDFGPAIPAAERALELGKTDELIALMQGQATHGIAERFKVVAAHSAATKEPPSPSDLAAAPRARNSALWIRRGDLPGNERGMHAEGAAARVHAD